MKNNIKLSICIDALYAGEDLEKSVTNVLDNGFNAVEFWGWENKNIKELKRIKENTGIEIVALCTGFISLTDPSKREAYLESLKQTIEIADMLNCKLIISQAGNETSSERETQHNSIVEGLRAGARLLEESDSILVLEPLNTRKDHFGYYLSSSDETDEIINETGSTKVKMLFDIYHQQISEGDIIRRIRSYQSDIGHFHAAGVPGRHELYHSEIDYKSIFSVIKETPYQGYIGLEYFPEEDVSKGLSYAKQIFMD